MADAQRSSRKALIVTINNYRDPRNDLPSCNADGDLVERLVKERSLGFEVVKLQDTQATIKGVEEKLEWLFEGVQADDRLLFYYSGHGAREVRGDTLEDGLVLHDGFYAGDGLSTKSQEIPPGILTVILDTCFTGAADRLLIPTPDGFQIGKSKCWSPVDPKQIERHHSQVATTQALKLKPFGLAPTTSILTLREARRASMSADAVTQGASTHGAFPYFAPAGAMREDVAVMRDNGTRDGMPREDQLRDDGTKAGKTPSRRVAGKSAEAGGAETAETRRGGEPGSAQSAGQPQGAGQAHSHLGLNGLLVSACLEDETASASTPITKGLSAFTCCLHETLRTEGFNRSTAEILTNTGSLLRQLGFRQTPAIQEPPEPANEASSCSFILLEPMPAYRGAGFDGDRQHLLSIRLAEAIRNSLQEQRAMGLLSAGIDQNAFWNDVGQIAGSVIPAVLQAMSGDNQSRDYWQMGGAKPAQFRQNPNQAFGGQGLGGQGLGGPGQAGQGSGEGPLAQHVAEIAAAVVPAVIQAVTREYQGVGGPGGQGFGTQPWFGGYGQGQGTQGLAGQGLYGQGLYGQHGQRSQAGDIGAIVSAVVPAVMQAVSGGHHTMGPQQGFGGSSWGGPQFAGSGMGGGFGLGYGGQGYGGQGYGGLSQQYGGFGLGGDPTQHHIARIVAAVVPAVIQTVSGGSPAMGPQQGFGAPAWGGQQFAGSGMGGGFGQGYGGQGFGGLGQTYGGGGMMGGDATHHHVSRLVSAVVPAIMQAVSEGYRQMGAGQMGQMGFGGGGIAGAGQQPGTSQAGTVEQIVASVVPNVVTQLRQRNAA